MEIVLSIRFDPQTAGRILNLARQASQTPSALIRGWTHERLAAEEKKQSSASHAVGETLAAYVSTATDFEALRERFRPRTITILLVGESRPAGGTFFYLANSRLYFATREAFAIARGAAPNGVAFLERLRDDGIWLYDVAASPVNQMSGRPRRQAVESRVAALVDLLRDSNPQLVVAIKRSLEHAVGVAMDAAGISLDRLRVLPFPLYQWRSAYVSGLADLLTTAEEEQPAASRRASAPGAKTTLSELARKSQRGRTQPVTENDLSHGQIRIPQDSKPLLPRVRTTLAVELRGRRLESAYDPRNGPDRSRSGTLRIPRQLLGRLVQPNERLDLIVTGEVVSLS
jgi:predicted transcriptional regulator